MNWLLNMRTGQKLALGFGTCIVLTVVIAVFPLWRMAGINGLMGEIVSRPMVRLSVLRDIYQSMSSVRARQVKFVTSTKFAAPASSDPVLDADMARMTFIQNRLGKFAMTAKERERLDRLRSDWQSYERMSAHFDSLVTAGDNAAATSYFLTHMNVCYTAINNDIYSMDEPVIDQVSAIDNQADTAFHNTLKLEIALLFWGIVIGIVFSLTISRHITRSLNRVSERLTKLRELSITPFECALQALEHGDLTVKIATLTDPIEVTTTDDIGQMAQTVNAMLDQINSAIDSFRKSQAALSRLVTELQSSASQVSGAALTLSATAKQVGGASSEISDSMDEVSRASEQSARGANEVARGSASQAQALSQGNDLVRKLTDAVNSVARDADGAVAATQRADEVAKAGGDAVKQTVDGMNRIQMTVSRSAQVIRSLGEASAQIGAIVGAIEEIADQTNLLALNAAIEAARAGEAGRGFAVVADEVRKLAERSRGATQEIGDLIGKVQKHTQAAVDSMQSGTAEVEAGTALAEEAGRALAQIQMVVGDVSEQVARIRSASGEMLVSSEDVLGAISEVAAIVEQSSAAAEEMSASAAQVSSSVQEVAVTVFQQSASVDGLVNASVDLSSVAQNVDRMAAQFHVAAADTAEQPAPLRRAA